METNEKTKEDSSLIDQQAKKTSVFRRQGPFKTESQLHNDVNFKSFSKDITDSSLKGAKKVIIQVGELVETYFGKLYKIIVSSIITTVFIGNDYFSYFTNPINNEKNFFLLREGDYFDINQWDPSMTDNRISEEKMQEFVSQLNFFFSDNDILNIIETNHKRKRLHTICFIFSFLLLIVSAIVLWRVIDTVNEHVSLIIIFSLITCVLLVLNICMLSTSCYSNREEQMNFDVFNNLLQHKDMVEDHVQKWNEDYFIHKGIIAYSTSIVNYIHFSLEKDKIYVLGNNREINIKS